jgi:hypothetical protein
MTLAALLPSPSPVPRHVARLAVPIAVALLGLSVAGAAPAHAQEAAAPPATIPSGPPVVVISYYESRDLSRLVRAVKLAGMPAGVPLYFGNYAGGGAPSGLLKKPVRMEHGPAGGRRAPIFPINPSAFYAGRQLPARQAKRVGRSYSGRIRSFGWLLRGSTGRRVAWGRELGRRFRDRIRILRRLGVRVATWQYDEIQPSAAGSRGRAVRDLNRGILQGLTSGRPQLGDRNEQGIVFIASRALSLAQRPPTPELEAFWSTVDRAALRLVGEEYVAFEGDPGALAAAYATGQRAMYAAGGARGSLARKYVLGLTPGYLRGGGYGGNVHGRSRTEVNAFRDAYVRQRVTVGVAGLGQFNFTGANRSSTAIGDAIRALVVGLQTLRQGYPPPSAQ